MLSPSGKELIEDTFGCKVNSTYSASETGRIGFECERCDGFHLNIDLNALRVVDESGRDVPPGEVGEIVVSNLHNRAMVLLNYRLGDWGALAAQPCPCGRTLPLLARLEGRHSEQITLGDGRVLSALVVDMLLKHETDAALKVQVVNPAPGDLIWRIVPFAGTDREAMRRSLLAKGKEVFGDHTRIDVQFVDDIPPTPAGKFAKVVRQVDTSPNAGGRA
jgi:phenylacetate-CoA ligase